MRAIGPEGTPLSATELQPLEQTEIERIERWRAEELERAGYAPRAAGRLAVRHDVDLHRATELLQRGCDPELALRILL
jgi:hypothetical protein